MVRTGWNASRRLEVIKWKIISTRIKQVARRLRNMGLVYLSSSSLWKRQKIVFGLSSKQLINTSFQETTDLPDSCCHMVFQLKICGIVINNNNDNNNSNIKIIINNLRINLIAIQRKEECQRNY